MNASAWTPIEPTPDEVQYLEDRLYEFNSSVTGITDGAWLAFFLRDESGRIVAGICGNTWGGVCDIRQFWVEEAQRGRGLGTQLYRAAEREARRRGCTQIVLTTFSFQAPAFYERNGFEVVATIEDHPRGHKNHLMRKRLAQIRIPRKLPVATRPRATSARAGHPYCPGPACDLTPASPCFCRRNATQPGTCARVEPMEQERPLESMGAQQVKIAIIVQLALAGREVARVAIVVEVLGVRQDDILAHQGKRLVEDLAHPGQFAGMEQVRRIDRDLQGWRRNLVQKSPRFSRIHNVVHLGFKGQDHARLSGDLRCLAYAGGHVTPRLGRVVVRVAAPHAAAVTRAGAHVNLRGAQLRAGLRENPQPPQACPALFGVGVTHIEGALHGRNRDPTGGRLATNPAGHFQRDLVGHVRQAGAVQAHLHTIKTAGPDGVQARFQCAASERAQQDADLDRGGGIGLGRCQPTSRASHSQGDGGGLGCLPEKVTAVQLLACSVHAISSSGHRECRAPAAMVTGSIIFHGAALQQWSGIRDAPAGPGPGPIQKRIHIRPRRHRASPIRASNSSESFIVSAAIRVFYRRRPRRAKQEA